MHFYISDKDDQIYGKDFHNLEVFKNKRIEIKQERTKTVERRTRRVDLQQLLLDEYTS